MAVTLAQLREITIPKAVEYGDITINLHYRPNAITPGYLEEVSKDNTIHALSSAVARFVSEWDIEIEDGVPLPVTTEGAAQLGVALLNHIVTTVAQDIRNPNALRSARR